MTSDDREEIERQGQRIATRRYARCHKSIDDYVGKAIMYSRISIKNFREIESLEATGLRHINLIVGRNNSGKTTFLESLFLLGGATNPQLPMTLAQLRGQRLEGTSPDAVWRSLCHNLDPSTLVEISGQWEEEPHARLLRLKAVQESNYDDPYEESFGKEGGIAVATPNLVVNRLELLYRDGAGAETNTYNLFDARSGNFDVRRQNRPEFVKTTMLSGRANSNPARYAHQFSSLLRIKHDKDVIDALRIIEPRVQRIEVLSEPSGPSIYLDVGLDALVPLAVCGEGIVRLFSLIVELTASRGGVLLIDEIDNGLHYSVMKDLWKLLGVLVARYQVQVFGTTHNEEIVRSALMSFAGGKDVLGLFRIDKRNDRHVMVAYNDEAMGAVLEEHFEVRG